jgi:hypothetical protein
MLRASTCGSAMTAAMSLIGAQGTPSTSSSASHSLEFRRKRLRRVGVIRAVDQRLHLPARAAPFVTEQRRDRSCLLDQPPPDPPPDPPRDIPAEFDW